LTDRTLIRLIPALLGVALVTPADPASAQWTEPPWGCQRITHVGSARHDWDTNLTAGPGSYRISFSATAQRCTRGAGYTTRVLWRVSVDADNVPRDRQAVFSADSAGRRKKWVTTCVRLYGSDARRCSFAVKGGTSVPRLGQSPLQQFRRTGSGFLRYARVRHGATKQGAGTSLSAFPRSMTARFRWYRCPTRYKPGYRYCWL
jgi:hypothetical protein